MTAIRSSPWSTCRASRCTGTWPAGLPLPGLVGLITQIAGAVGYAHQLGILHRDLKPANILVTAAGQVKLVDFGLAKLAGGALQVQLGVGDNLTETGAIVGTVSYLSPEQARGEAVDAHSDLFALGVIFYEMLAGRRPFDRETPLASLTALLHDPPAPLDPALPPGLRAAVERLLAKDPADRYPSADLLISDLGGGESALAITPPAGRIRPPAASQRRWLLAAACVALAALAGAGLWFRFRPVPAPPGPSPDSRVTVLVLPIAGGPDERGRYLAGLVTGELIATLNRAPGMRILHVPDGPAGRAAALRDKVLQEQSVRYIVAGRLVLDRETLRVALQLSRHPDAVVLWSDTIRGGVSEIFDIPGRVAAEVGRAAGVYVAAERLAFPGREAFEHYTRGDILYQAYDAARVEESIAEFERCIAAAPDFLPAYEQLTRCLMQYHNLGLDDNPAHLDRALRILEEGLSRRPDAPRLLAARAWLEMYTYDVARARETLRPVLDGGAAIGADFKLMSFLCLMQGDPRGAEAWLQRAIDLDPLDVNAGMNRIRIHSLAGPAAALEADLESMRGLYPPPAAPGHRVRLGTPRPGRPRRRRPDLRAELPAPAHPPGPGVPDDVGIPGRRLRRRPAAPRRVAGDQSLPAGGVHAGGVLPWPPGPARRARDRPPRRRPVRRPLAPPRRQPHPPPVRGLLPGGGR